MNDNATPSLTPNTPSEASPWLFCVAPMLDWTDRPCRFFERLLVESGVDAETASAEACRMEHCLSEDSYRRFAAYLGSRRDEGDGG